MQLEDLRARRILWRIRMAHTIAWAVFASSTIAIPFFAAAGRFQSAVWLSLLVWGEVVILAANRLHCPLRAIAARYTADRSDNFDIFLPAWLSRHNLLVFGWLFAIGQIFLLWLWARA